MMSAKVPSARLLRRASAAVRRTYDAVNRAAPLSGGRPISAALSLGLLVLLGSCRDEATAPKLFTASQPARDLSDGANGGRRGFFFLPPLVSQPKYNGVSDANQSPSVVVCELVTTNPAVPRCGAVKAAFSRNSGTGAQLVRYDAVSQEYIVNWQTDQCLDGLCTLDGSKTYRLRVLVGTLELGHADVVFVSNASQIKNAQTGEVTALVNGRTLPIKFRIETGAVSVVTPGAPASITNAGGSIATTDGQVALEFSANALVASTPITVSPATNPPAGVGAWSSPIELGPDGTTFSAPVALTMHFDALKLPRGVPLAALRIFTQRGGGWTEVPGSVVNEADNTVSAPIQHFSVYGIFVAPSSIRGTPPSTSLVVGDSAALSGLTTIYEIQPATYCNPVKTWTGTDWSYSTSCYTVASMQQYPVVNQAVTWSSSNGAALAFHDTISYSDASGFVTSPPLFAISPGTSTIRASAVGAIASVDYTSLGKLGILPRAAELVAGWSHNLEVTQSVPTQNAVSVSLTSKNSLQIGEAGTSSYTNGGQTGSYTIPANASSKRLTMAEYNGPRTDTLIASSPGYLPDTAVIQFVQGKIVVSGWPSSLAFGDSVPLTFTATDQGGSLLGNLAHPAAFDLVPSSGLAFSDGRQTITSIVVQQRTSPTFYLKAIGGGAQTVSIKSRDYLPYTNAISVGQPVIDPFPQHRIQLYVSGQPGTHVVADVPINNAGTGTLRNMRIGSSVNECYNGTAVTWIKATFTEGVVPVIMHLAIDIPPGTTQGQYDFCYTLVADGAPARDYGVRLVVTPEAVIDPYPQGGTQLQVSGVTGTHITKDVPINNAGSGALRNMRIGSTVNNCYNGSAVDWIKATFTEGVVPVIMHLSIDPPLAYEAATHDFCYTLVADNAAPRSYGVRLTLTKLAIFEQVSASGGVTCALREGIPYCWGDGYARAPISPVPGGFKFRSVSAGSANQASCGLTSDDIAYCWGAGYGSTPMPVPGTIRFKDIDVGGYHTCGISTAGALYCWGGIPGRPVTTTPVAMGGPSFTSLKVNLDHGCALTPAGAAYCWGVNSSGQLGAGTVTSVEATPVAVTGGHVFSQLSGAWEHSCALALDGTAYCWGVNHYGELGSGTTAYPGREIPTAIPGFRFTAISAGFYHSCGLTADGSAYCWGDDRGGRLGRGFFGGATSTASLVAGGKKFIDITLGQHGCGREANGATSCWGPNDLGELGDGTNISRASPVAVTPP